MVLWLQAAGVPLPIIPLFLVVAFLIFIALSRIVVEAGVALVRAPLIPPDFIIATFGVDRLGARGLTGLAYTYPWTADLVTFPMASVANGLKMAMEVIRGSKRALFWATLVAILVTLVSAYWMMLYVSYEYGGLNLPGWWWQFSADGPGLHHQDDSKPGDHRRRRVALHRPRRRPDVDPGHGAAALAVVAAPSPGSGLSAVLCSPPPPCGSTSFWPG